MRRVRDWRSRLTTYLESHLDTEFKIGDADCCTFASGAVMVMTGVDPMKPFRGVYKTSQEATAALKKLGANTLKSTMISIFGKPVRTPRAGDIAYRWGDDGPTLGVCTGAHSVFLGEDVSGSLVQLPTNDCRFFKVG